MRILILDEEFPYPLNTGKRIRSFNLARGLAKQHEVAYVAFGHEDSPGAKSMAAARIKAIPVEDELPPKSGLGFYGRLAANLFSSFPYSVDSHYRRLYQDTVDSLISGGQYDLVLCEWTPYARYVLGHTNIPRVVVAHNIEAQIWRRLALRETNPARRWYIHTQADKMDAFERSVFRNLEAATAVSQEDAAAIQGFNHRIPVEVINNGVDLEYFRPSGNGHSAEVPHLVFTGSMDWRPNQDAAIHFTREILPSLRSLRDDLRVTFVGRNPSGAVCRLAEEPGVEVTGTVDDVRPYIASATAFIVPLRIGGGSRLKILEAMAMGKAVVSTRVGAEGLEVTDGKHLLIAEQPTQWVESVSAVLSDSEMVRKLGEAGRRLVEERYGWSALVARLSRFLEEVVSGD